MDLGGWRPQSEITVLDGDALARVPRDQQPGLRQLIDALGEASARAQRLPSVITTYEKLYTSGNQRLYLVARDGLGLGLLKMGVKKLFVRTDTGRTVEMDPLCCLDFYVHESQQRRGMGKRMFEFMLREEGVEPRKLAYDRPSPKLIGFMSKHYRLSSFVSQPNHYVVFDQYFDDRPASSRADRSVSSRPLSSTKRRRGGQRDNGAPESLATSLDGLGQTGHNPRGGIGRPPRNNGGGGGGGGGGGDAGQWGGGLAPIRGPGSMGAGGLPFEHISMAEQNRVPRVPKNLGTGRAMPKALRQVRGGGGGRSGADARNNEADFTRQLREQQLTSETDRQVMHGGGMMAMGREEFGSTGGGGRRSSRSMPADRGAHGQLPGLHRGGGGGGGQHRQQPQQQQAQQGHQPSFLDRIEQQANATGLRSLNDPNHFTPDAPLPRQHSMPSSSRSIGPGPPVAESFNGMLPGGGGVGGGGGSHANGPSPFGRPSYSQPSSVGGGLAAQGRVRGVQGSFLSTSLW